MKSPRSDPQEIARALALLHLAGDVIEMRVPKTERDGTVSGYFDNRAELAKQLAARNGDMAVYVTLNPCSPALLARCVNRIKSRVRTTTSDKDIARRLWILIDCDPTRPAEISSTDAEHEAALERARDIRYMLSEEGWPEPILADSGNGAHLLYCIDLPNDEATTKLIAAVLKALARRFSDAAVTVDETVYNAARIVKAYGTVSCKGDNLPERPHRLSRILDVPSKMEIVPRELLEGLAAELKEPDPPRQHASARRGQFDMDGFAARNLKARPPEPHEGGRKWVLENCPFNEEHQAPDAAVFQRADGSLAFHCFHNSCANKTWRDVRELFEGPQPQWNQWNENGRQQPRAGATDNWPDPLPIGSELPSVDAFDPLLLPEALRSFVEDVATRMQVPLDYPGACLVTAMAGAVSRRARIQPKAKDSSWRVTPNLWGGIIGLSGFMKSPTLNMITAPLQEEEAMWRAEYAVALEDYELQKEELELRLDVYKSQTKASFKSKSDKDPKPLRPDTSITPPVPKRLITCDSTFEKLHVLMQQNPAGLLVIRDELTGWWAELDREGRQGERGFFLSAWNGDTPFTIDRVGRGSIHVPACCVSMIGGITPGRLRSYLVDALEDGPSNDGLPQRFQLMVWPDPPRTWDYVDETPATYQVIKEMFERILKWDLDLITHFRFNAEAQEFFIGWLGDLERKIRSEKLHPAMVSHLAKYRKLMPALGLLLSAADQLTIEGCLHDPPLVFLEQAQQAARWCTYLESHAKRVYGCVVTATMQAAADLAAKLKGKAVEIDGNSTFAVRDVYRHHWSHLDTPERARAALDVLEDAGWVRRVQNEPISGRPPDRYTINPRVHR